MLGLSTWAIIVVLTVLFLLCFVYFKDPERRYLEEKLGKLPGPLTLPLLGNTYMLKKNGYDNLQVIAKLVEEYREWGITRIWIGREPNVWLLDVTYIERLLTSSTFITKGNVYRFLKPWLNGGLLLSTGDKWRVRRKLLTPAFHLGILNSFMSSFNEHSNQFVQRLKMRIKREGSEPFDICPYITACALDTICETAMGVKMGMQEREEAKLASSDSARDSTDTKETNYVKAVLTVSECIAIRMKSPWFHPDLLFNNTPLGWKHSEAMRILHDFTRDSINQRMEEIGKLRKPDRRLNEEDNDDRPGQKRKRQVFLDLLLEQSRDEDGSVVLSDADIQEEVDTFMFEGHDTTAAVCSWSLHLLALNQEHQDLVYTELEEIFSDDRDRPVTSNDLKKMVYLERCIKESLRLYPPVPFFSRECSEDLVLNDKYTVPKGAQLIVLPYFLHRDPQLYPDPEVFDPDRFTPEKCASRNPFAFIPFSGGQRNCIGQRFAMMELKVILSNVLRNFKLESMQQREDVRPLAELINRSENGIILKIEERKT